MEGTEKEEIGRDEDFGGRIPKAHGRTKEEKETLKKEAAQKKIQNNFEKTELSDDDAELMKERERLRKERKDRSTKRLEKRKKEFRKKLYIACGGIAILLLSLLCLIRFKAASPNRILKQNENTIAESVQLTLVKQLSEEEKTKLESYAKEEGGIELHFLNPEIGEEKIKSEILSLKTDLILGGEEQNVNFLSKLSEEEKIPYLATTFVPKDSLREHSFCLSRSAEDQAVDLSFFAYNEAFRSMGILLPEGKADLLSKEITEAFQELGGVVTVYSYTSEDDFRAKLSELETAGIDILFLEYYNEEANTILAEEHNFTALLGNDWDRADFPGDTERKTNCLLYGKNTKNETVSDSEISEMETSSPEQESISSTQVEEESEATSSADSVLSIVEDEQVGREKDAIAILQIALKNKGKSLMEKLSDLQYQGIDGTYELKAGDYALKGKAVFYEIIDNKRVELS